MRIGTIRVIQLKKDYVESMEGQNHLIDIVDEKCHADAEVSYSEGEYNINDIAVEASYCNLYTEGENLKYKKMMSDLFLGDAEFEYPYTRWEIEMNEKNPTQEQIADYIVHNWYYPIESDDTEELEQIAQEQKYAFHDCVVLRWICPKRVKEIVSDYDRDTIIQVSKALEKELNQQGVFMEGSDEENDLKLLDDIMRIYKNASEENTGVLYIMGE